MSKLETPAVSPQEDIIHIDKKRMKDATAEFNARLKQ